MLVLSAQLECEAGYFPRVHKIKLQAVNTQSYPQITLFTGKGVAAVRGMVRPPGAVELKGWKNWRKTYILNFKKSIFCPQQVFNH